MTKVTGFRQLNSMGKKQRSSDPLWLLIPPIPTFIISLYLAFFSRSYRRIDLDVALWIFIALLYLAISIVYVICISRNFKKNLIPLQMLAQGLALLVLPMAMGAPYGISWIGIAFMTIGIISITNLLLKWIRGRSPKSDNTNVIHPEEENTSDILVKNLPFPALVSDNEGNILNLNKEMCELLKIDKNELFSQDLNRIFPSDMQEIKTDDKKWIIRRKEYSKNLNLLYLTETTEENPDPLKDTGIIDVETGLLSRNISDIVITAELKRSFRYRRWLSVIFLRIVSKSNPETVNECPEAIGIEYGKFLKSQLRECDMAFRINTGTYLLLLPETPGVGAKNTLKKLKKLPEELQNIMLSVIPDGIIVGSIIYCSGNHRLGKEEIMKELGENLGREEIIVH